MTSIPASQHPAGPTARPASPHAGSSPTRLAPVPAPSVRGDDELESRGPEPHGTRGFVLYVDLSEAAAQEAGTSLERVANALRVQLAALLPAAETSATLISGRRPGPADVLRQTRAGGGVPHLTRVPEAPRRGVVLDPSRRQVKIDGRPVALAPRELDLLFALVGSPGATVSRRELVDGLWQAEPPTDLRAVDVIVGRLRSRLGSYGAVILTVRGSGYRFDPHPDVTVTGRAAPLASEPPLADLAAARRVLIEVEKYVNDAC